MHTVSYSLLDIRHRNVHRALWVLMGEATCLRKCVSTCLCVYCIRCQWRLVKFPRKLGIISYILKGWVRVSQTSRVKRVFTVERTTFAISERHVRT